MSIFDDKTTSAMEKVNKEKLKGSDFEKGLVLQYISNEKVESQWGAEEDSKMVEKGILEEGQQFLFTFKDELGDIRKFYTMSFPFVMAMHNNDIQPQDWIKITRTGKGINTKYMIEKVEEPISPRKSEVDINIKDIPF